MASPPLVEPDVRISRIRLSRKPESEPPGAHPVKRIELLSQPRAVPGKSRIVRSRVSPKRHSRPLTEACYRSAPSLRGRYSLPRYYGLSDSRSKKKLRVSQVPRPICPHAPPPTTPES